MKFPFNSTNWWRKFIIFGWIVLLSACGPSEPQTLEITGSTMGTSYMVKVVDTPLQAPSLQLQVDERLVALNQVLSTYIPTSELSLLNTNTSEAPISISAELRAVLAMSWAVSGLSDGAFDVTVGPLVNLWGFGPGGRRPGGARNGVPSDDEVSSALAQTGFNRVILNEEGIKRPAGIYIDLSAIAKGYAVDEISRLLEESGTSRYMVEIGGEVRTRGRNPTGGKWIIGLEAPDREARRLQRTLPVQDLGMATSGDYRNYFEYDELVYSHTIDPKTGWPVTHNQASVTVLHPSAGMADGLATAFSVLGPEKTMTIAEEMRLPVLAILREAGGYREVQSSEMKRYLQKRPMEQ